MLHEKGPSHLWKGERDHEKPCTGAPDRGRHDPSSSWQASGPQVSSRTIISLEKGQYNPSLLLAYRLALVFRTTVEDLYCLAENKEQEDRENEEWT